MSQKREREEHRVAVALESDGVLLGELVGAELRSMVRLPVPPEVVRSGSVRHPGRLGTAIRRMMREQGWRAHEGLATLGGQTALVKTVQLPPMPAADRPAAVRSQIEPYVIFGGEEIEVAVEANKSANPGHSLLMAAVPLSRVSPLARAVTAAGLELVGIEPRALAIWRSVVRYWEAQGVDSPSGAAQVAMLQDDDAILLILRGGARIDLIHRVEVPADAGDDAASRGALLAAAIGAGLQHMAGAGDALPELSAAALIVPGGGDVAGELAAHFPAARLDTQDAIRDALLPVETDEPAAALALAGMATGAGETGDEPRIDLVPGELARRRALLDELRLLAGSCALIWVFMLVVAVVLRVQAADEAVQAAQYERQLGGSLGNIRRLERLETEVSLNLDYLQTLSKVIHALPEAQSRKLELLASCLPPDLEVAKLKLRPTYIEISGRAVDDVPVLRLMHGLRELKAKGEIGEIEIGNMHRDPTGREPHTEFQIRFQQFPPIERPGDGGEA